jgi:hypothetical protein
MHLRRIGAWCVDPNSLYSPFAMFRRTATARGWRRNEIQRSPVLTSEHTGVTIQFKIYVMSYFAAVNHSEDGTISGITNPNSALDIKANSVRNAFT